MPGTLYIVSTPIGNLADISFRAVSTLKEVDLIAAEDTRVTHNILARYEITTPTTPYHQHSLDRKTRQLIEMLVAGKNIALVSDAGTPGISDPGYEIIQEAIRSEIPVVAIPGPNAIITALVVSGLPTWRFAFDGFPPRRPGDRRAFFKSLEGEPRTMVFYESPLRLPACLKDMLTVLGDRRIAVVREATKMFEEVHRGTIVSAIERFGTGERVKGEITIVLEGIELVPQAPTSDEVDAAIRQMLESGISERDTVKEVAKKFQLPKREVYRRVLNTEVSFSSREAG